MTGKILKKHINDINEIIAGDQCFLREIFHPERDHVNINFSLAHAHIHPGGHTIAHYLLESEIYYIISGTGMMHIDNEAFEVQAGNSYIVPPKAHQWLENKSSSKIEFLVIVNPPWKKETEFIIDSADQ